MNSHTTKASNTDLVSVIMIFLDEKRFIQEAIESILAQTYGNWELLLVDDGSRDGSSEIARCVAAEHSTRVRYLEHAGHQNLGMSASRNLGVRHAKGTYIAFLDADDVWVARKLEQQLSILRSHPAADMVCGSVQYWYSWTGKVDDSKRDIVVSLSVQPNALIQPLNLLIPLIQHEAVTSTISLIRRDAIIRVGGYEESFRGLYEDQAFFAKLCSKSAVYVANECWYKWRKHLDASSYTGMSDSKYRAARLKFLLWLENYLSTQDLLNAELSKVLRKQIWVCRHAYLNRIRNSIGNSAAMKNTAMNIARYILPAAVRRWLQAQAAGGEYIPPVGWVRFGSFRRCQPFSREWGTDRGLPIDRYYIERFLSENSQDISGHVLEIGDDRYTRRFGSGRVARTDVLHVTDTPQATIIADLTSGDEIASDRFDCIICAQTLPFIYDVRAAIRTLHRILKPGGILLATLPGGFHQISRFDMEHWGDYWRFTSLSARMLFEEMFGQDVQLKAYGNVMAATAFINGLAVEDLRSKELDYYDTDYEVSITVRAVKRTHTS
jgi:glycosyltransferase involved in cell wall biosynthesis/SAM-dependent methyltransferase